MNTPTLDISLRRRAQSALLAVLMTANAWPLRADPVPDPAASMRPSVSAVAGVTMVDIVAPDARGASHNRWTTFDVPAGGLVLNNAVTGANSALVGAIAANPNLVGGAATLIVNEVTGGHPSELLGRVEVAGASARLVIANPNGITCDGCGFVGTPHVQLTTGRPVLIDDAVRFDVSSGRIHIGAGGLSAVAARIDLIAHAVSVRGPVGASGEANVVAAPAIVDSLSLSLEDYDPAPHTDSDAIAIDIGQTVSADSIRLIAVGGHVGVRTTAPLQALGDVLVASRQQLDIGAAISAGHDIELFNIGSLSSTVSGQVRAGRDLRVVGTVISLAAGGELSAGRDIALGFVADNSDRWTSLDNAGLIEAAGAIDMSGLVEARNSGTIRAGLGALLAVADVRVPDRHRALPGGHSLRAADDEPAPVFMYNAGRIEAGQDLYLNAADNNDGVASAGRDLFLWQSPRVPGRSGSVLAGRDLFLFAPIAGNESYGATGSRLFRAGRDLYLLDAPDLLEDPYTLGARLLAGRADLVRSDSADYLNRDTLAAGQDLTIALDARFVNEAVIEAGRDLVIAGREVRNETPVQTTRIEVDYEYFDGCRTWYRGMCAADIEGPGERASLVAGRNMTVRTQQFVNRGASVLAGAAIDLHADQVLNEDRRYGATWSSRYYLVDPDAMADGGPDCSDTGGNVCANPIDWLRTASGSVELGVLPGIIQAGGDFTAGNPPGDGGTGAGDDSTAGEAPVTPAPPMAAPSDDALMQRLASIARLIDVGAGNGQRAGSSSFINTGSIHAATISVRADDIRNGFDMVKDYYHRTAELALPPAAIDVAAFGTHGNLAVAAGDYSGDTLMRLLPPALASDAPFALTPQEELAALRNALLATTHRAWILPGLSWDPVTGQSPEVQQRAILAANGYAFALEHGIPMGTSLDEAGQARVDVPMLWYVERGGELRPWVYLPEDWQTQLAVIPGGVLDADVGIVMVGRKVDNTGFVLSDGSLSITADELENRKRSAYYHEEFKVDGGTLIVEGSKVQPGGFMQAAHWALDVDRIHTLSGEFRVLGESVADTALRSAAFEAQLAAELGSRYVREEARDDLHYSFEKDFGFGDVMGLATSFLVASMIGADISSFIGSFASPGSSFAAASSVGAAGLGNTMTSALVTQTLSSAIGQIVSTGRLDMDTALNSGLTAGLSAGSAQWTGTSFDDPFQRATARALTSGLIGELTGSSFEAALLYSAVNQSAAYGAGRIGDGVFGEPGSVGHLLAHGALGALAESARGGDPMAGALGAMTATLVERPLDGALGLSGTAQGHALLTALSMMAGGAVADAAGGDPLAGAFAAQNVTLFNFLKHPEQDRYASAKNACAGDAACLQAVDADFGELSLANKRALAEARIVCETTGFCTGYYRLMTEAMPFGMGARLPGGIDPENPWLGAQQNADAIAYNLALFDRLMARPLSAEVVRQDFAPDPEAYQFAPQGSSHYVGANTAENIDKVVVVSAAGASLLLPGPEDLAVGAVLMTKAGQFVARVIEVGGQKLLRLVDGSTVPVNKSGQVLDAATGRESKYLDALTSHPEGHAFSVHGGSVTDGQLAIRARTGVKPNNAVGPIPPLSSAFHSDDLLIFADQAIRDGGALQRAIARQPGQTVVRVEASDVGDLGSNLGRGYVRIGATANKGANASVVGPVQRVDNLRSAQGIYEFNIHKQVWETITVYPAPH